MTFARELRLETQQALDSVNDTWQKSVAQTFQQVVTMTAVGNPDLWKSPAPPGYVGGTARASWLAAIVPDEAIGTSDLMVTPDMVPRVGGTFTLYSNLPYMKRLEDGWSRQAGDGMVKVAEANWDAIVRSNS